MEKVFIALGGNVGNVCETFNLAKKKLKESIGSIIKQSSLYKTEPWGNKEQDYFLNQVLITETNVTVNEVLKQLLFIEKNLGRTREKDNQYAPRAIDIDLLFYGREIINTEDLIVPHPRLHLRNFVLTPLMEIAPDFVHPLFNKKIKTLCKLGNDNSVVEKL